MTDLEETLGDLANNRQILAEEVDQEEYGDARITLRWMSESLEQLATHIGAAEDVEKHNELVDTYNAALEQWNGAEEKIRASWVKHQPQPMMRKEQQR